VINKILDIYISSQYDFREFAYPEDEFSYLFEKWVDYYRMKYSICKAINPERILEVGVRYGYSALAFLNASPDAYYIGIDNDTDTFGGRTGAIEWAKKHTKNYNAEFLIKNSFDLKEFPGEKFDLIHIDGQQDGDGTFHDLELAIEKGVYILVDGYFWSSENFMATNHFIKKYKNLIEYCLTIPGYAGEMLIKVKRNKINLKNCNQLKEFYDSSYFLEDCGGYDAFLKNKGRELKDIRLTTIYCLTDPLKDDKILDIGCGRGELAFSLAKNGNFVKAIDYSKESIEIAKTNFSDQTNLIFEETEIFDLDDSEKYNKIIAADFVEHVEQEYLEKVLKKAYKLLKDDGYFIIHTSPNKLKYLYEYKNKTKEAKKLGLYLPENPRTYYEDLMHINEFTPARLNRTIKKYFEHTICWVNEFPDNYGSLYTGINKDIMKRADSIFIVASKVPINKDFLKNKIYMQKLSEEPKFIKLKILDKEIKKFKKNKKTTLKLNITNNSDKKIFSKRPYPVNVSYHWIDKDDKIIVFDGLRTEINFPINPRENIEIYADVLSPNETGNYKLIVSLVQEANFWFESVDSSCCDFIELEVY